MMDLATAIEDFWRARGRGEYFPHAYFDRLTLDDAYRIQLALIDRREANGERHIGWKVGLTAKPIQEQFGFHEPVFGCILEARSSGERFGANELLNPGFETELCLRLGSELRGSCSQEQAMAAVDAIHPAFEIVETRGDFTKQMPLAIADNAQQRSVVLGAAVPFTSGVALEQVTVRVTLNHKDVASGQGSAVLGNPINSLVWLAGKLDHYRRQLHAGDIVMTGSFVRQFPLGPGDVAFAEFSDVGCVETGVSYT